MTVLRTIITIAYIVICIALSTLVLIQEGKMRGLGAVSGTEISGTYWGKAKKRSKEARLKRITLILSILFFIISVALSMHPIH